MILAFVKFLYSFLDSRNKTNWQQNKSHLGNYKDIRNIDHNSFLMKSRRRGLLKHFLILRYLEGYGTWLGSTVKENKCQVVIHNFFH